MNSFSTRLSMVNELTPEEIHLQKRLESIPEKYQQILFAFFRSYQKATLAAGKSQKDAVSLLSLFLSLVEEQFKHPYPFSPYHQKVRRPFDYYRFGLDFIKPLVDLPHSRLYGEENLQKILEQLKRGENAIL